MDMKDFLARLAEFSAQQNAEIAGNIQGREALLQPVYLDLSVARPKENALKIGIAFKSVCVENPSDSSAYCKLALGDNTVASLEGAKILKSNDSFEFTRMVSSSYLWWPAQSGKYMTLVFATTGVFKPGSQVSQLAGGVSILDGSGVSSAYLGASSNSSEISVAATATLILPADSNRKMAELEVIDADVRIGDSGVTATTGVPRNAGSVWEYRSTAALYAIPASGGAPKVRGIVYT